MPIYGHPFEARQNSIFLMDYENEELLELTAKYVQLRRRRARYFAKKKKNTIVVLLFSHFRRRADTYTRDYLHADKYGYLFSIKSLYPLCFPSYASSN